jgi:hypothetical protein
MTAHRNDSPSYAIALVALPWAVKDHPSAALAALGAYVQRERPSVNVTLYSEFVNVAGALGDQLYDTLADRCHQEGELIYMALVYPSKRPTVVATVAKWAEERLDSAIRGQADDWGTAIEALVCLLEERIGALARELKEYDALGLTTTFGQTFSSIALAREVKNSNRRSRSFSAVPRYPPSQDPPSLPNTPRSITSFKERASSRSSSCWTP